MARKRLIQISKDESILVRKNCPNVHITIVNKTHPYKHYFMTAEKIALRLISDTNSSARRELTGILEKELEKYYKNKKKKEEIENEIQSLKDLGI